METVQKITKLKLPDTVGPEARVWIYQSSRPLKTSEIEAINIATRRFTADWQAHGTQLVADHALLYGLFLVLFVDETQHGASGCSIDASVHFVQAIEKEFGISLMSRTQAAYLSGDAISLAEINELKNMFKAGEISRETLVFNNLVTSKGEMESNWIVPISNSWHARFLG